MTTCFPKPAGLFASRPAPALPAPAPFARRAGPPKRPALTRPRRPSKEYLQAVRAAELAAWDATTPSASAQLRAHAAGAAQDTPAEKRLFTVLLALSLAGVAWGLTDMLRLVEHWPRFVALVRQLVG